MTHKSYMIHFSQHVSKSVAIQVEMVSISGSKFSVFTLQWNLISQLVLPQVKMVKDIILLNRFLISLNRLPAKLSEMQI